MARRIVKPSNLPVAVPVAPAVAELTAMTGQSAVVVARSIPMDLDSSAKGKLTSTEYEIFKEYATKGGFPLAISTAMAFFELYLNGYDVPEIHRLNSAFPLGAIYWAKVQNDWDQKRETILNDMTATIKDKVMKAQLETTGLMADILIATNKKYRDKIKRYLQTGDDTAFNQALNVESIQGLLKLSEGLLKLTGQANTQTVKTQKDININVQGSNGSGNALMPVAAEELTSEEAATVLAALAAAKRRKEQV